MGSNWLPQYCLSVCFLLAILDLSITNGMMFQYSPSSNLTRIRRQAKGCDGFKCQTTQECIAEEKECDGTVDCQDGSDEFNTCAQKTCPGYLFTCDYGACIDADARCDRKKDCRDNSDEAHCISETKPIPMSQENCKSDQFRCNSGQCIELDSKCNGISDCPDNSDETKETCLNIYCPGYTFKCDYGGCVDGYARCNGVQECIDNSDEENCDATATQPPIVVTYKPITTGPGGTTEGPRKPSPYGVCTLPNHPASGFWKILGNYEAKPGEKVEANTILQFSCKTGYKLSVENGLIVCMATGWNFAPPTCMKLCPPLYSNPVTRVKCFDADKREIKCTDATTGSTAKFECETYYEPSDQTSPTRYCIADRWNQPAPLCIPVCGEKRVSAEPLIVNGTKVEKGDYPWVTAVYQKHLGQYVNVCGGSILSQRVILTAAHCVTNDYGDVIDKSIVAVGVGKYYNRYNDSRDTQAQYSELERIIKHEAFKGENQRYASDIAILVTKDTLLLSKVVQPVCFSNLPQIHLTPQLEGVVTGWGFTLAGGEPSDYLKEVTVPYKDDATCYQELPKDWADKYLSYDKLCAGLYNRSTSVCKGDSGGGLVFKNTQRNRYFIHGIVSVANKIAGGCDIQVSSLYTKVATHYDWLEARVAQYTI